MYIQNFKKEFPCIYHCQGNQQFIKDIYRGLYSTLQTTNLQLPEDLSIITVYTDESKALLVNQLKYNNIPYINAFNEDLHKGEPWEMYHKIDYIYDALKNVTTEYVIIVDAYDVLFNTFEGIIDKFEKYNTSILFNASKNNYPVANIDRVRNRDWLGSFNNFNAGCCIGLTKALKLFYKLCKEECESNINSNYYNSEQFVLRRVFSRYSENITFPTQHYVTFDYNCSVFLTLGNGIVLPTDENDPLDAIIRFGHTYYVI